MDKEWKKLETIPAWDVKKVKSKKVVMKEAQKNNNKVHFASLMDLFMSSEEFRVGATIPEGPMKSCTSRRQCERPIWSL